MTSHTLSGWLVFAPLRSVLAGAQLRGYTQTAAAFYEPYYYATTGNVPQHRTRDRSLGRMRSVYAAVLGQVTIGDFRLVALAGATRFFFLDFPPQSRRTAFIGSLSVAREF